MSIVVPGQLELSQLSIGEEGCVFDTDQVVVVGDLDLLTIHGNVEIVEIQ